MPKRKSPKSDPKSLRQSRSRTSVEETLAYWTEEAMAAAKPLRLDREPRRKPKKEPDDA